MACNAAEWRDGIVNGAVWYVADGTMQDWNYNYTGALAVTVELSCEKWVAEGSLRMYWEDNKYSLLAYIGQVGFCFVQAGKTSLSLCTKHSERDKKLKLR